MAFGAAVAMTRVRAVVQADPRGIREAASTVRGGGVVAYPTETVYGLGANPLDTRAVDRVYEIKGRNRDKAIILLVRGEKDLRSLVAEVPETAVGLMRRFWPGPLTLVFRAKPGLPAPVVAEGQTVALRVSPHPVVRRLLTEVGGAITSTSANRSGEPPAQTGAEAVERLGDDVDLVLDGGAGSDERPSTVVDVSAGGVRMVREGRISEDAIQKPLMR